MALCVSQFRNLMCIFCKTLNNKNLNNFELLFRRQYAKNVLRRLPLRVLDADGKEIIDESNLLEKENQSYSLLKQDKKIDSGAVIGKKGEKLIVPPYEKLEKNDARFTKLLVMMKSKNRRIKSEKILIEGVRLINDAIEAGLTLKNIFFSKEETLAAIKLKSLEDVEIQKVFYKTLSVWSSLTTCPGIMGVFKKPTVDDMKILTSPVLPVTVICDNIRDPGNLGSIIRNAASAGCRNILLLKGCVDPWEVKVLRAACGGNFRIPIVNNIEWPHLINYLPKSGTLYVADSTSDVSVEVSVPEFVDYDETIDVEQEHRFVTLDEDNKPLLVDESYEEPSELEKYKEMTLPCRLYSDIDYPKNDIFLYVGGETHGVDPRVLKLASEFGGKKIRIPLENEMESLNAAFAFTIVLYEIKRQLSELYVTC